MSHTTFLHDEADQEIGHLIHNSDWSGDVIVFSRKPPDGTFPNSPLRPGEIVLPGEIVQAIRRSALNEAREALEQLVELIGLPGQ